MTVKDRRDEKMLLSGAVLAGLGIKPKDCKLNWFGDHLIIKQNGPTMGFVSYSTLKKTVQQLVELGYELEAGQIVIYDNMDICVLFKRLFK